MVGVRAAALGLGMMLPAGTGALAAECNRFALRIATDPIPYQHVHGLEKTSTLLAAIPRMADAIYIGDSLVEFWPQDMIARQFPAERIWNIGVGGGETQTTLWLLDQIKAPQLRPRRLFVLVGTNNLTHESMPACAIAAGIKAVVLAARAKWPAARIDIMGVPPRGRDFHFRDADRLAVNRQLQAWSRTIDDTRYFEVDAADLTCGRYDAAGSVKAADSGTGRASGNPCINYADDFGHFRRPGYDVIFSAMPRR